MQAVSSPNPNQIKKRFVILAASRSGSNMLCTMLDSHPSILCHHELYNPKGIRLSVALRKTNFELGSMSDRDKSPEAFLERIWNKYPETNIDCVGFKFTHRQNNTIFRRLLSDSAISKIVLRRKNRMKTYVSQKISESLSEWEVYQKQDLLLERPRVVIDPSLFLERVAFDKAYYNEIQTTLRTSGQPWIEVFYEDLFSHETPQKILQFLGLKSATTDLKIGSIKQNSCNLRDLIANYDELLVHFAGTAFNAELMDSGN